MTVGVKKCAVRSAIRSDCTSHTPGMKPKAAAGISVCLGVEALNVSKPGFHFHTDRNTNTLYTSPVCPGSQRRLLFPVHKGTNPPPELRNGFSLPGRGGKTCRRRLIPELAGESLQLRLHTRVSSEL